MESNLTKGLVAIYACGGCGINIGSELESTGGEIGFADRRITAIDTSATNLPRNFSKEKVYLIDGLDGSGFVRSENVDEIRKHTKPILQKHQPADLNIVVSSGGGGSGSVIAPLVTKELAAQGKNVIVVMIGCTGTAIEITNTIKTMQTYEQISRQSNKPIIMIYLQNAPGQSAETQSQIIDRQAINSIYYLSLLFSKQNRELDTADLNNWLDYSKVTQYDPRLAALTIIDGVDKLNEFEDQNDLSDIVSIATVAKKDQSHGIGTSSSFTPEYQCVGYLSDEVSGGVCSNGAIHFIISDSGIANSFKNLEKMKEQITRAKSARLAGASISISSSDANSDIIV